MSAEDPTFPTAETADKASVSGFSQRLAAAMLVPLALVLTALILVFYVFFQTGTVNGTSMLPTLQDHEYLLITRGLPQPKRGDIVTLAVIFRGQREEWVKRVVAIGGDTVDVSGDVIRVNGAPEAFRHATLTNGETQPVEHLVVPPGRIFVAGDNRGVSEDSRYVGTFAVGAIRGKVVAVYAPIERIRLVPGP